MDEIHCSFCGIKMSNRDSAYGLTSGIIDKACYGFRIDDDSEWDIFCSNCMNEIDRMIANFKMTRQK